MVQGLGGTPSQDSASYDYKAFDTSSGSSLTVGLPGLGVNVGRDRSHSNRTLRQNQHTKKRGGTLDQQVSLVLDGFEARVREIGSALAVLREPAAHTYNRSIKKVLRPSLTFRDTEVEIALNRGSLMAKGDASTSQRRPGTLACSRSTCCGCCWGPPAFSSQLGNQRKVTTLSLRRIALTATCQRNEFNLAGSKRNQIVSRHKMDWVA